MGIKQIRSRTYEERVILNRYLNGNHDEEFAQTILNPNIRS